MATKICCPVCRASWVLSSLAPGYFKCPECRVELELLPSDLAPPSSTAEPQAVTEAASPGPTMEISAPPPIAPPYETSPIPPDVTESVALPLVATLEATPSPSTTGSPAVVESLTPPIVEVVELPATEMVREAHAEIADPEQAMPIVESPSNVPTAEATPAGMGTAPGIQPPIADAFAAPAWEESVPILTPQGEALAAMPASAASPNLQAEPLAQDSVPQGTTVANPALPSGMTLEEAEATMTAPANHSLAPSSIDHARVSSVPTFSHRSSPPPQPRTGRWAGLALVCIAGLAAAAVWRFDWMTDISAALGIRASSTRAEEVRRPAADWAAEAFAISLPTPGTSAKHAEPAKTVAELPALSTQTERISEKAASTPQGPIPKAVRRADGHAQPSQAEVHPAESEPPQPPPLVFDRKAASKALAQISGTLGPCMDPAVGRISTEAAVTFAPSGRVTQTTLQGIPAMRGSPMVDCVVRRLREATVPAFDGESRTVRTIVTIE